MIEPPSNQAMEVSAALAKGIISAVPGVGGVLSELGNLFLNPLERRKQRWMTEVSAALNEIAERFAILPVELEHDDRFTTFLYQATLAAFKTHQAVKLGALRNSLVNSVAPTQFDLDIGIQYLRYIDELTPSHLLLLATLEEHVSSYAAFTSLEELHTALVTDSGVVLERSIMRAFLQDLEARFLIRLGDLAELPEYATKKSMELREESAIRSIEVTAQGGNFLSFIRP